MIDPRIPLMAQQPDVAGNVMQAQQFADQRATLKQRNRLLDLAEGRAQETHDSNQQLRQSQLDDAEIHRQKMSFIDGALQLKSFVESGDMEGAQRFLSSRLNAIQSRGGDPEHTQYAIDQIAAGNTEGLMSEINASITAAEQQGLIRRAGSSVPAGARMLDELAERGGFTEEERRQAARVAAGIERRANLTPEDVKQRELAKLEAQNELKGDVTRNVERNRLIGKVEGVNQANLPKARAKLNSTLRKADNVISKVDEAVSDVGFNTSGFVGSVLSAVPGTDAFALKQTVLTIKANLGFDTLQEMRDNSPTGGALGQVAVQELEALQSAVSNLDLGLPAKDLVENLDDVRQHYTAYKEAVQARFNEMNGEQAAAAADIVDQPSGLPEGARQAPDGNYYVERDGKFFRVDP